MTGTVEAVNASLEAATVIGSTCMQQLANARLNQVYENQNVDQIVRDLVDADVAVGVALGVLDALQVLRLDAQHQPLGDDRDALSPSWPRTVAASRRTRESSPDRAAVSSSTTVLSSYNFV